MTELFMEIWECINLDVSTKTKNSSGRYREENEQVKGYQAALSSSKCATLMWNLRLTQNFSQLIDIDYMSDESLDICDFLNL